MREHMGLYRGKRVDNGEWVEGNLVHITLSPIQDWWEITTGRYDAMGHMVSHKVDPDTVGECTGRAADGKLIFEGDIVEGLFLFEMAVRAKVSFQDGSFGLIWHRGNVEEFTPFTSTCNVAYKIIGNIHDNPELLKARDDHGQGNRRP